ncbi:MAG: hypothetical protein IJD70_06810 [Clostridia bacterium]|nr:hypothetical protein [Clostridia bacterium]
MKKILALALCLCMVLCVVACGEKAPEEKDYKLGMGIVVSMGSSATNNAQVDATVATVVTDADGKIVLCRIDVAQNKMDVTNGAVDTAKTFETKMELGDRYGMAGKVDNNDDGVMKEWHEQTKAFETYVTGKTVAEVEAIKTQEAKGHQIAVDEALLSAGCSMQITDFIQAVVKACKDEQGMSFKTAQTFTLGVAAKTTAAESTAATAEAEGEVKMYTDFAASVVADGKILASLNDAIQPVIKVTAAGEVAPQEFKGTKRELKEGYNMATYGANLDNNGDGKVLEWYEQSLAFSKHVVGKTGAEVAAMKTVAATQGSVGYMISADDALLTAGCTIQIGGICAVVAQSVTNAR